MRYQLQAGHMDPDTVCNIINCLQAEVIKLRKACVALALECHATKRAIFPTTNLSTAKTTIADILGECEI